MAETYGITDIRSIPIGVLSELVAGLPEDSRSVRKITGRRLSLVEELLAAILDSVNILSWQLSKDGAKGRNKPESVLEKLAAKPMKSDTASFESPEDFESARKAILEKVKKDA